MNSIAEIKKYYENIELQFDKLNLDGKYSVISNIEETEKNLQSLPDEFFKAKFPTKHDEDKMLKRIKALVNQPSNKSKQKMLKYAQTKYDKIKKINEEILILGKKLGSSDKNTLRDPNLLHKRIKCWEKRNQLLKQLADVEYDLGQS